MTYWYEKALAENRRLAIAVEMLEEDNQRLEKENADIKAALAETVKLAEAAMLAGEEWLPIEEAPKDGTRVLVVVEGGIVGEAYFDAERDDWWWANESWGDYHAGPLDTRFPPGPTHFRPLPAPPVSPEAREEALERLAELAAVLVSSGAACIAEYREDGRWRL